MRRRNPESMFILNVLIAAATIWLAQATKTTKATANNWRDQHSRTIARIAASAPRHSAHQKTGTWLSQPTKSDSFPGLPLAFIENCGQVNAPAAFLVQGRDTSAYFTLQGITLALTRQIGDTSLLSARTGTGATRQRWNLKLDFVGASASAIPKRNDLTHA